MLAGDTYGFAMTGGNFDSDDRLLGTLTVTDTTPAQGRGGYCSAAGNTDSSGVAIPVGSFLDLLSDQPARDPHYTGATPAIIVQGRGITCDPLPAGFVRSGFAGDAQHVPSGLYAYYTAP